MNPICFFVPGVPAPGGSKKFVGFNPKNGRALLVDDAGKRNKNWRALVAAHGYNHAPDQLLEGAIAVNFKFFMPRPKKHYRTGKFSEALRPDAPTWHTVKPDVLKLTRSTEDALTSVVWKDDCTTATITTEKRYGEDPGCMITISTL